MRGKYFFSDIVVMSKGINGKYTNLSDFGIGQVNEVEFPSDSKYLISIYSNKKSFKMHGYYGEISFSDLLKLASIKEKTEFVTSIKRKFGNDLELAEDMLAIMASKKINNTLEGYFERVGNTDVFEFRKRKIRNGKEIYPVITSVKLHNTD